MLPDGFNAAVVEPFTVVVDGETIHVPSGWITDWASVPRFFWRLFPPIGRYTLAAVVHDYLYEYRVGTRKRADRVFLRIMEHLGVPWWKRTAMYWAVRLFGGRAWRT